MKYNIEFFETLRHVIQVEAENRGEAELNAENFYYSGDKKQGKLICKNYHSNDIGEIKEVV